MNTQNGLIAFDCPICSNAIEMSAAAFQGAKSVRCANCGSSVDLAPGKTKGRKPARQPAKKS